MGKMSKEDVIHKGGCHCGRVRFEVQAPAEVTVGDCNCSICSMGGYQHLIVAADAFKLEKGEEAITTYEFGTGVAKHLFCKYCGIKSFYVPRSHPDGISVNMRCLDPGTVTSINHRSFDGRNWEQAFAATHGLQND